MNIKLNIKSLAIATVAAIAVSSAPVLTPAAEASTRCTMRWTSILYSRADASSDTKATVLRGEVVTISRRSNASGLDWIYVSIGDRAGWILDINCPVGGG